MRQYCRYCSYMCCGDANYCSRKAKCLSDSCIKRVNHCKDFSLNEIDTLGENEKGYKPRTKKENKQLSLLSED